ncbi:MAG: hypothetical protein ACTSYL_02485 [Candidatus Thorarchaeota archaeon]
MDSEKLPKQFRDRDVFQDKMQRIFVAVGHIQPLRRVISYLKYVPDSTGQWISGGQRYRRVFTGGVASVLTGMAELPDYYLMHDPHLGTVLPEVSMNEIAHYFSPENRLREILEYGPLDSLEETVKLVAEAIHDYLGIGLADLGVTGSISWRAHSPRLSDVNINVYGLQNAWCLQNEFEALADHPDIRLCTASDWNLSSERLHKRIPSLEVPDINRMFQRRRAICYGRLRITPMPILRPDETPIPYGSESYSTVVPHPITVRMQVVDDTFGLFLPAILSGESEPIAKINGCRVTRVMIYNGAFRGVACTGDQILITGFLQQISKKGNPDLCEYQLMVGTKKGVGREFFHLL